MRRLIAAFGLLAVCAAILPACSAAPGSGQARSAQLPAGQLSTTEGLMQALRAAGARVKAEETVTQPFFSMPARLVSIEGEGIQVFQYPDAASAQAQAALVSPDGRQVGTSKPRWVSPPHFYKKANLLILYLGEDEKILKLLDSVLGPQFAGA